jgi:hypothetical protein
VYLAGVGAADVGVFVEKPGPPVHFQGQVGDLHLGEQSFYLAAQGDQGSGFGLGVQRGDHDLVAAASGFDAQVGVGGVPGGGAPPRRVQAGGELAGNWAYDATLARSAVAGIPASRPVPAAGASLSPARHSLIDGNSAIPPWSEWVGNDHLRPAPA